MIDPAQVAAPPASSRAEAGPAAGPWPTAERIRERAPLLAPLLVVGVLTLVSAAAMVPLARLAYAGRPELLPTVLFGMGVLAVLSPVTALVKCLVLGAVAWAVIALAGAEMRYRSAVSLLVHAQSILVAQSTWVVGLLWMRGARSISAPEDLALTTGLDALLDDPTTPVGVLAHAVDPFQVLWVVALTLGLAAVARTGRGRAATAALAVWALAAALPVLRAWL